MNPFKAYLIEEIDGRARGAFATLSEAQLDAGEVTIRVAYSSVNYKDALAATGAGRIIRRFPCVGGIDLSGVVESSTDLRFKPGDAVEVGDLLFELVDAQSAKNASRSVAASASGVITLMNTVSGAQVYRGQLLCEVADMSTLELSAEVDELDLNSVAVGDTLTYTLDAFEGETFVGTVTKIYAVGTKKQNATYFDVRITLPSDQALLPGMNGTVTINK